MCRCGIGDDGSSKEAEQHGKQVTTAHSELLLAIKQTLLCDVSTASSALALLPVRCV